MDPQPLVSIIINNYNYGSFVGQAIDSALNQTYKKFEIIVVDDGSTDHSREVISAYGEKIICVLKENGGQASAINAGFKQSKGSIILFLDADDYLSTRAVEAFVEKFDRDKIVKAHWPLWRVDVKGKKTGKYFPEEILSEGDLREQVIKYGPAHSGGPPHSPPASGNAWARSFLEKVMPVPEAEFRGGVDNYLFVLAPVYGEIRSISEPLGYYRVHGTNNTLKADYMTTFFSRFEYCCNALSHHLLNTGMKKDPTDWPRDHWYHKVFHAMNDIASVIPSQESFLLVDENLWLTGDNVIDRKRIYFPERNGEYWGIPSGDDEAIGELKRHQLKGIKYIVLAWTSFWWLDHFKTFGAYLLSNYNCVLKNERTMIYEKKDDNSKME